MCIKLYYVKKGFFHICVKKDTLGNVWAIDMNKQKLKKKNK